MRGRRTTSDRSLQALHALGRVREVEQHQAEGRLNHKRVEMARLGKELEALNARRQRVSQRRGSDVLHDRLLLDALMRVTLERGRALEALNLQTAILLEDCREAQSRSEAVQRLRERRIAELELVASRRAEAAAADLASALRQRREGVEEDACEP